MSFNTFVLTGQKQKGWNEMKSKIEDKITNMYHNLDPSIKKMKHEDIAKHLQSKFLETEPNFLSAEPGGTGFFQGRRSMLLLIIMLLVYSAATAAAAYRSTEQTLLLTDGEGDGDGNGRNGNDSLQQHTGQSFGQLRQIQRNQLLNRHIVRNVPQIMITFAESVGTLLQTFRMDSIIASLGIEPSEMSETYLTNTIIPAVQNNWIGKADGIFFNDIDNDVEGSTVQRDTAIKMLGYTIQKALVYDEDFEKSIHHKDFEKAEELAREFTSVKIGRYQIEAPPESDRAREQVKVCKDIVNRLKNGDQVVLWKEGFQLNYGDSLPIEKLIESESWGAIDTLQEKWMVDAYDQEEILKEATTGVWSIVISHIAWEITKNDLLSTDQTASLANQMGAARENMEVSEVIIKDAAIAYLRKQTGAPTSLKRVAVNDVMVEISQGIKPIMDTLYVTIVGFRKVMAEEAGKSQADRLQNTIDSLVPSSTWTIMMSMIGSMSPGMVIILLTGGVATSAATYVAWTIRKVLWKILKFPFQVPGMLKDKIRGTPTNYSRFTVAQLKILLGDRGLSLVGVKADLIQRLLEDDGF